MENCILLGYDAGLYLPADAKNVIIIGDGITEINKEKFFDCVYIGNEKHIQIIIGTELFGKQINVKEVMENHFKMIKDLMPNSPILKTIEIKKR